MEQLFDGMGNNRTAYIQNIINDYEKKIMCLEKELKQQKENLKVTKKNANTTTK